MADSAGVANTAAPGGGRLVFFFPRDDVPFSEAVEREIARVEAARNSLSRARRALRSRYPRSACYYQAGVEVRGKPADIWVAYRDGRGVAVLPAAAWWEEPDTARVIVDRRGELHEPSAALLHLATRPSAPPATELDPGAFEPELLAELANERGWLARFGSGGSTTVIRRTARDRVEVEFHAVWDGAGAGRHVLYLRTLEERQAQAERAAIAASILGSVPDAAGELVQRASRRWTRPGERLGSSIRGGPWAVLVVAGVVRVYLSANGTEPTVLYGAPSSVLGSHWFADDGSSPVALQAVTPALLLELDAIRVQELLEQHPEFARAAAAEGRRQLISVVRSHAQRTTGSLLRRLAAELVMLWQLTGDAFLPVTEQQLAEGIGSIRESVARAIVELRRDGSIATTRFGIVVVDLERLQHHAGSNNRT